MRTGADWDNIRGHTATLNSEQAPWAVVVTVVALIGDDDPIGATWVEYRPAKPTRWKVSVVTQSKRLAYAELEFKAEGYDGEADQHNPTSATINAAWIRPLSNVVKVQIGKVGLFAGKHGTPGTGWFPVGDVQLLFGDGEIVKLDLDQAGMGGAAKRRSDKFLAALRAGVTF
jgi:hypothetical protein